MNEYTNLLSYRKRLQEIVMANKANKWIFNYLIIKFASSNKTEGMIMERKYVILKILILATYSAINGQVTTVPELPTINDAIRIIFNATGSGDLENYSGEIYAHTGVITNESVNDDDWKHVKTDWGENTPETNLTRTGNNLYELTIEPDLKTYYGLSESEKVIQMAFVFRNEDGTKQTANIYLDVYEPGLNIVLKPENDTIIKTGATIGIMAKIIPLGTGDANNVSLFIDDKLIISEAGNLLTYEAEFQNPGNHVIVINAENTDFKRSDSVSFFVAESIDIQNVPENVNDGINYINDSTVTFVLYAPFKEHVFLIGDFNNWEINNDYLMKKTPSDNYFWLTLNHLTPGKEYIFQYLIDGNLRIADPYTEKTSDPQYDEEISNSTYPDLSDYPAEKTDHIASMVQTAQSRFEWENTSFTPPQAEDLVIYELLIRDFSALSDINTVFDSLDYLQNLGINAIELMPVNEFEGNESWGYNPSFYFAPDKAYGTEEDYKRFIDECHRRGIAVILDMVFNHSYGQSPMVRQYFNPDTGTWGQPTSQNPWYNESCPHEPWCWGYDFNHESDKTKKFVDRVNEYWLTEYNIDGFRFDFTKGLTNKESDGWTYDASRIAILKRMYDNIKAINPDAYVILEHFTENKEEKELANYGFLIWGKMTDKYNEATMGYNSGGKSDISDISYLRRGWDNPHLVGYMESHDEERLMYKNLNYGNSNGDYDVKHLHIALQRVEAAAAFFFTIPGPKMIWMFGELGYDISIDEPCRVCNKPVRWDYYEDAKRKRLYQVFAALIKLRKEHDVFRSTDFDMDVNQALKRINLHDVSMNVTILGNFDIENGSIDPFFQSTGTWYEYFTGDSVDVTDVNGLIALNPGEYRLYTDIKLEKPEIIASDQYITSNNCVLKAFPNPSNHSFTINFSGHYIEPVQVTVLNSSGQIIKHISDYDNHSMEYVMTWNGKNDKGYEVGAGIYFLRVLSDGKTYGIKLIKH